MAKFNIDLSGRKGLAPQHQGHIDGSTPVPQYSYLGGEGQLADGTYNPFYRYGYMAPANDVFTALTGTISDRITSAVFDEVNDDLYLGTDGPNILRLDGLDDTSLTTDTTIDTDRDILDMELCEVAGTRACVYVTDSSDIGDGMSVGFFGIDSNSGLRVFDLPVVDSNLDVDYETIGNSSTNEKLAQKILYGTDVEYKKCDRIRVRLSRLGVGTSYTIKVGIQRTSATSNSAPDGTFIAYGTVDPSTISQITDSDVKGHDVYVDLNTSVTFDSTQYWIVVEPTVIGDMTGTNSFVWYRSNLSSSLYTNGRAYAYTSSWGYAINTTECFDCSLILSKTENWFPVKDAGINTFNYLSRYTNSSMNNSGCYPVYLDETHFITAFTGSGSDGYVRTYSIDISTGSISLLNELEFDTTFGSNILISIIDSTHFLMVWRNTSSAVVAQAFSLDGSYVITALGSPLTLTIPGAGSGIPSRLEMITSTKFVVAYLDTVQGDATLQTLSIDGSYNVTQLGSSVDLDTGAASFSTASTSMKLLTGSYVACVWEGTSGYGYIQVFHVNTTSGDITLQGSPITIDNQGLYSYSLQVIDSTHFVVAGQISTEGRGMCVQCYVVDGSYNVSAIGTHGVIDTNLGEHIEIEELEYLSYCVLMKSVSNYHYLSTFKIDSSYNIDLSQTKIQRTSSTTTSSFPKLLVMNKNLVVCIYENTPDTSYSNYDSYSISTEYDDNNFYVEEGQNSFIRLSDNGLLYWFVGEKIHTIDGSLTGGLTGSITKEVLTFPSYLTTVDAVDTNGYMFIGIHSNLNASGSSDIRNFSTSPAGVYVWDRLSSLVRTRDYVPIHGVREIKRMFLSYSGDVMLFCINNAKQTELRRYSNGKFVIVQKLNKNGYPPYKHSIQYAGNMVVWQAQDGKMYACGQTEFSDSEALFKIGDVGSHAATSFAPGIIHVSNDLASGTPQVSALVSWSDDTTKKLSRWHINGTGTINSVAQTGHIGNVHTLVYDMPAPIHINYAHLYGLPVANDGVGNTTVIATIKVYYNKNTTAEQTFSVTRKDMQDGYVYLPLNQKNVVSISFEIEYNTTQTLGSYDLYLQRMVVEYNPELQSKK